MSASRFTAVCLLCSWEMGGFHSPDLAAAAMRDHMEYQEHHPRVPPVVLTLTVVDMGRVLAEASATVIEIDPASREFLLSLGWTAPGGGS
jgi:hypothetical protein